MPLFADFLILAVIFFVLFLLPGLAVTSIFFARDGLDLFQQLAIGFCFSLGIFLVVFLTVTALQLNWQAVNLIWALTVVALTATGVAHWRSKRSEAKRIDTSKPRWLDATILVFIALLAVAALLTLFTPRDEDDWSYYQIVRGFVDASQFRPLSPSSLRTGLSVWWFFHAYLIHTFNFDIVRLGRDYLPLLLIPLSFMAFYTFARMLLPDRKMAVAASVLQLGFFIVDLFYNDPNVQLTGGWVLGRIDQDHTAAEFIFLPVYLALVYQYIESGSRRWLMASFFAMITLSVVHPQGFVQASILMSGFIVLHLAWSRHREDLKRIGLLLIPYAAVFLLLLPFILYWSRYIQSAYYNLSQLASNQSEFPFTFRWITFLSPTDFVLRTDLLGQPLLLSALLLSPMLIIPSRNNLNARYLLGSMLALFAVLYSPLPFVLLSHWIGWPIYRIWYLFPSVLVIVYLSPYVFRSLAIGIAQVRRQIWNRQSFVALVYLAGIVLVLSRFPDYVHGPPAELSVQQREPAGAWELFAALREDVNAGGVVLAPRNISDPIPSYRTSLEPVLFRYNTSQERIDDVTLYYHLPLLTSISLAVLNKYNVTYLVIPTNSESISQFDLSPNRFMSLYRNAFWALYRVKRPLQEDALVQGNTLYMKGDLQGAIERYNLVLSNDPNNSLAHLGLGMVLQVLDKPKLAAQELETATRIAPSNAQAHYHLAQVYQQLGMDQQAKVHAAAAGPLMQGKSQ